MQSDADPSLAKFSAVTDAFRTFPKPIFTLWLRFRRNSADVLHPRWRKTEDKRRKIELLDDAAALAAMLN